ncbi:Mitochondrial adenine nucleotide transporter ADNT1 [Capsicum annuum]|nr:Mitochondrial adenine nucleotide transporter ADNT1 [Capsicum annuum]
MASEDVKASESAVEKIVNLAEEAKLARQEIKPTSHAVISICKSLVAGGVAGGVSRTAVAPLERLKILLQVQNPHNIKYNGTISGLKYIWRTEGFKGLFKGNGTNCARIVPNSAVKFFSYEQASKKGLGVVGGKSSICSSVQMRVLVAVSHFVQNEPEVWSVPGSILPTLWIEGPKLCCQNKGLKTLEFFSFNAAQFCFHMLLVLAAGFSKDAQLTPLLRLGAGACAGIIAMSATYPMDMVRGRITVQTEKSPYQYRGMFHALSTILREEGPRALYKGWLPSVIGVIPYVGLNFAVYESLKDWLVKTKPLGLVDDSTELGVVTRLACGAVAGTVGQTVAYPLDVVRRRMQMVGWKDAASIVTGDGKSKASVEYSGMIDTFRKTVRYEGFRALYKGLVPNSVKVVPSIAIAFVTYEQVKDLLGVEIRISD